MRSSYQQFSRRTLLIAGLALGALTTPADGGSPAGVANPAAVPGMGACDFAIIDALLERSFAAPKDSIPVYCGRAEGLLLGADPTWAEEASWLSRLALVNGRLAEFEGKTEKVARVRRVDELCRAALEADSTEALAHVLLGVLNYRLSKLSCIERLLARAFAGHLPRASLEDSEAHLRRAIELQESAVYNHYALARTLEAMKRYREAAEVMRDAARLEPVTVLDRKYSEKAAAFLEELEDKLFALENSFFEEDGF